MELHRSARLFLLSVLLIPAGLLMPSAAAAQSDTTAAAPLQEPRTGTRGPQGALWRAAAVPGWGQIYNRQYYKVPFVYLGLGGITAAAFYLNDQYRFYNRAYLYRAYEQLSEAGQDPNNRFEAFRKYEDVYDQATGGRDVAASQLRSLRDSYRRNRDLSYFGIGLFYGLTILDAYVNAHLLDFDVGEDLSVRVHPQPGGVGAALRFRL